MLNIHSLPLALLLAGSILGQGGDTCEQATPITGLGSFSFTTEGAVTEDPFSACGEVYGDVWFRYTAAANANLVLSTCGTAQGDTRVRVYNDLPFFTSCTSFLIACDDGSCGSQGVARFPVLAGEDYLIRIGSGVQGQITQGSFQVAPADPLINPANGHAYEVIFASLTWGQAQAEAQGRLYLGRAGSLVTIDSFEENQWIVGNLGDFERAWIGLRQDTSAPDFSEPAGGWGWASGAPLDYLNWAIFAPSNSTGTQAPANRAFMVDGSFIEGGQWGDAAFDDGNVTSYIIEWGDGVGSTYCGPAVPNSTGQGASIGAAGSDVAAEGNLTLAAAGLPPQQFGIFINSLQPGAVANPGGSQGVLCVIGAIGRYNRPGELLNSGPSGAFSLELDLTDTPTPSGAVGVLSGETWYFQAWYRDFLQGQGATSNFTDALEVTFQ